MIHSHENSSLASRESVDRERARSSGHSYLFVELIASGRNEEAYKMMTQPDPLRYGFFLYVDPPLGWQQVQPQRRSLMELISGTAQYRIATGDGWTFTVSRGQVVEQRWIAFQLHEASALDNVFESYPVITTLTDVPHRQSSSCGST
jgi:hypothetical protein